MVKKTYESPIADKIAFNYRDQVVAASGDILLGGGGGNTGRGNNSWNSSPGSECYKYSHQKNGAHVCEPG